MADRLKKYRAMRDFGDTPEPSGGKSKSKRTMFVVQKHRASHLHYDFRLEMEGVLKSWAVPKGPSYDPSTKRLAMMTEDHPYDYGGFEGVIPEGNYGAGNVIIWDTGSWEFVAPGDDPVKALASGKLTFRLKGKKLFGEWALVKIRGRSVRDNEWLLMKHNDEFANPDVDVTSIAPESVVSGTTVEDLETTRTWESNRGATTPKRRTVADALREKKSAKPKKAAASKKAGGSKKRVSRTTATTTRKAREREK